MLAAPNITNIDILNYQQVNMKSHFSVQNKYKISSFLLYSYIKFGFPTGAVIDVMIVNQLNEVKQTLKCCDE